MSTTTQSDLVLTVTPVATAEVKKFMDAEGVSYEQGGLRVSVQPGGCSGFKFGLLIEDQPAEDDLVLSQEGFNVFVVLLSNRVNPTRENARITGVRSRLADAVVAALSSAVP